MNGISLMIPISCCPVYNLGTSNNMKLIPLRSSNLHLQSISPPHHLGTTTQMLNNCRVYSASSSSSGQDATWMRPTIGGTVVPNPNSLFGVVSVGLAALKHMKIIAQSILTTQMLNYHHVYSASSSSSGQDAIRTRPEVGGTDLINHFSTIYLASFKAVEIVAQIILTMRRIEGNPKSICTSAAIILVAGFVVAKIYNWLSVVTSPSYSIGDVIKFGSHMEGQVIETGPVITLLSRAYGGLGVGFTNTLFASKVVINKSRARYHAMDTKIILHVDTIGKIRAISEEIENMMKSNSNVYLEEEQPYFCCSGFKPHIIELTLVFKLKKMSEMELASAMEDILHQLREIIMKHGAKLV